MSAESTNMMQRKRNYISYGTDGNGKRIVCVREKASPKHEDFMCELIKEYGHTERTDHSHRPTLIIIDDVEAKHIE
jgi:hypothetical protein